MGRVKDLVYTGVHAMTYESDKYLSIADDLLRENKILRKNVYDLQLELKNAYKKLDSLRECAIELYSKASSGVKDDRTTK